MVNCNTILNMTRRQAIPSRKGVKNFLQLAFALGIFILSTCNFSTEQLLLARHLADGGDNDDAIRNAEMFQITLTGVPDRLPTKYEAAFFEAIMLDFLKPVLADKDIQIYEVKVRSDKSIHYQRYLNEKFTVAGEKYKSNGNMQIDQATMIRVNENNRRVLGSASETDVGGQAMMHQLSLMVVIKGMYHDSPGIVFDSMVMAAINEGQTEIQHKLTHSYVESSKQHEEKYFKDVEFVLCVGVGPRDKEPILEMTADTNVARTSKIEAGDSTVGFAQLTPQQQLLQQEEEYKKKEKLQQERLKPDEEGGKSDFIVKGKSGGGDYSVDEQNKNKYSDQGESGGENNPEIDLRDPNFLRTSNSQTNQAATDTDEEEESSSIDSSFDLPQKPTDAKHDPDLAFNAQAVELRTISGLVFLATCMSIGLMHLLRVVIKKNEDRKKRIHLAKKAYGGPLKESKIAQSSFYKSNKFTGTMDTGAGF